MVGSLICLIVRLTLQAEVKKLGSSPSAEDKLKLIDKRKRLQTRIDAFISRGDTILEADEDDLVDEVAHLRIDNWSEDDSPTSSDDDDDNDGDPESGTVLPEMQTLPLPSARTMTGNPSPLLRTLMQQELQLQIGHANDALHKLRLAIGHKSFFYRKNVRPARNYDARTRAYANVRSYDITIQHHANVYKACKKSMVALGATDDTLEQYQDLEPGDLRADTTVINPNERGHRNDRMAWIWGAYNPETQDSPEWLRECKSIYCTNITPC